MARVRVQRTCHEAVAWLTLAGTEPQGPPWPRARRAMHGAMLRTAAGRATMNGNRRACEEPRRTPYTHAGELRGRRTPTR